MKPGLSVVVPVYNEEANILSMHSELSSILEHMLKDRSRNGAWDYEVIFIDDGSTDSTLRILTKLIRHDRHLRVVEFRRNFGQTAAMAAGLDYARYSVVVTLDGDLQNDPAEIPRLVAKLEEGYDLVAGWRKHRNDAFISRKLPSKIANWLISTSTKVKLHDYGCTLKAMTLEVAKGIRLYGEMHRFIPALADELGAKIAELPVNHRARKAGKSKYGISRTLRVILDLVTVKFLLGYSKRPIHLFGTLGLLSGFGGFALLCWLTYQRMFMQVPMGNRPLLALAVMMIIIGFQFLVFGLLGEVLARTYHESQGKRVYTVRKVHAAEDQPEGAAMQMALAAGAPSGRAWERRAAN